MTSIESKKKAKLKMVLARLQKFEDGWHIYGIAEGQIEWIRESKPENCNWVAPHGLVKESDLD